VGRWVEGTHTITQLLSCLIYSESGDVTIRAVRTGLPHYYPVGGAWSSALALWPKFSTCCIAVDHRCWKVDSADSRLC
jgi:hypothetical protein